MRGSILCTIYYILLWVNNVWSPRSRSCLSFYELFFFGFDLLLFFSQRQPFTCISRESVGSFHTCSQYVLNCVDVVCSSSLSSVFRIGRLRCTKLHLSSESTWLCLSLALANFSAPPPQPPFCPWPPPGKLWLCLVLPSWGIFAFWGFVVKQLVSLSVQGPWLASFWPPPMSCWQFFSII